MKILHREFARSITSGAHASTITFLKDEPVISWFGGTREGARDVGIFLQYQGQVNEFGGKTRSPWWNPILFTIEDNLYLFAKTGDFCDRWQTFLYQVHYSEDAEAYGEKIRIGLEPLMTLPAGLNGPVKTKPIFRMDNKRMYVGSSVETNWDWTSYIEIYEVTDDPKQPLKFIRRSNPLTVPKVKYSYVSRFGGTGEKMSNGIIQPSLWLEGETMHAFFRSSRGLGKIYHSKSDIDSWAETSYSKWDDPMPTEFDNPNSGVDTVYFDNRLFLVYNPDDTQRTPLVVAELDEDLKVKDEIVIGTSDDVTGMTQTKELSYPYMVEQDGKLHLTYTYGRSKIEYIVIEV